MPWSWRYESVDGQPVTGPTETFSSQADAGVTQVVLVEDDRVDYRMSLLPAE